MLLGRQREDCADVYLVRLALLDSPSELGEVLEALVADVDVVLDGEGELALAEEAPVDGGALLVRVVAIGEPVEQGFVGEQTTCSHPINNICVSKSTGGASHSGMLP